MLYRVLLVLALGVLDAHAAGVRLAGFDVPPQAVVDGLQQPLVLNGAGIRYKFFFKIYVGALYLPRPEHRAEALLVDPPPNRVLMHFVYSEVSRAKLDDAWDEGFRDNLDDAAYQALAPRIQQFKDLFVTLREGDEVWLDYLPGRGTRVSINGQPRGTVPGRDFNAALLSVWLGREPVTSALKKALLSADTP